MSDHYLMKLTFYRRGLAKPELHIKMELKETSFQLKELEHGQWVIKYIG